MEDFMKDEKMIRLAKVIDTIMKIVSGFALAGAIIALVVIPAVFIFRDKAIDGSLNLEMGSIVILLSQKQQPDFDRLIAPLIALCVSASACAAVIWYSLGIVRKILDPVKAGKPFTDDTPKNLARLGWAVIVFGVISSLAVFFSGLAEINSLDLSTVFMPGMVQDIKVDFRLNASYIVFGLLLFLLARIFRHGAELQQEYDETL